MGFKDWGFRGLCRRFEEFKGLSEGLRVFNLFSVRGVHPFLFRPHGMLSFVLNIAMLSWGSCIQCPVLLLLFEVYIPVVGKMGVVSRFGSLGSAGSGWASRSPCGAAAGGSKIQSVSATVSPKLHPASISHFRVWGL